MAVAKTHRETHSLLRPWDERRATQGPGKHSVALAGRPELQDKLLLPGPPWDTQQCSILISECKTKQNKNPTCRHVHVSKAENHPVTESQI